MDTNLNFNEHYTKHNLDFIYTTKQIRKLISLIELFKIVYKHQKGNDKRATLLCLTAMTRIHTVRFLHSNQTVADIFKDEETFVNFCKIYCELQSEIRLTCIPDEDIRNIWRAIITGYQNPDARCLKSKLLNRFKHIINLNSKELFCLKIESFVRASAKNNQVLTFDLTLIDNYLVQTKDTLDNEEEQIEKVNELCSMASQDTLFNIETSNFVKAGNKYPKKVLKVKKDDFDYNFGLFDGQEM